MRTILLILVVAMLMTTVGVFAASMTGSAKTLGGTGSVTVSAPATSAAIAWTTNTSGQVTGGTVTWTPAANLNYTIRLTAGGQTGTVSCTACGIVSRADAITLGVAVAADTVTSATAVIAQD